MECSRILQEQGQPSPRTCDKCQLGPCTERPDTPPPPDSPWPDIVPNMETLPFQQGWWYPEPGVVRGVKVFADDGKTAIVKAVDGVLKPLPSTEVTVSDYVYLWEVAISKGGKPSVCVFLSNSLAHVYKAVRGHNGRGYAPEVRVLSRKHMPGVTLAADCIFVSGDGEQ